MKHSDWKDWLNAGLYFLVMLFAFVILIGFFALLSHSFGGEQELTAQDIKVIHNINQRLKGTPLDNYGAVFLAYARAYKQNPYLSPAISIFETSAGKKCPAPYNAFCQKNKWKDQKKLGKWKKYKSFREAIEHNNKNIQRIWGNYATPERMTSGKVVYAVSGKKWRKWVKRHMGEMEEGK